MPASVSAPPISPAASTDSKPELDANLALAGNENSATTQAVPPATGTTNLGATSTTPKLYLYVWAGLEKKNRNDFVAVIDVTEGSPTFGKVISEAEVPTSGNEPHHVGLNNDSSVSLMSS